MSMNVQELPIEQITPTGRIPVTTRRPSSA